MNDRVVIDAIADAIAPQARYTSRIVQVVLASAARWPVEGARVRALALGASPTRILLSVIVGGASVSLAGIAIGLTMAAAASRVDPLTALRSE